MGNKESRSSSSGNRPAHDKRALASGCKVGNYKPPRLGPQEKTAAQARAIDRYHLGSKKPRKAKGSLQRKEQILAVLEDADSIKNNKIKIYRDEKSGMTFHSLTAMNEYRLKKWGIPIPEVPELPKEHPSAVRSSSISNEFKFSSVSSSTNVGRAAINRMQRGEKSKRPMKTADMVLADGISESMKQTSLENTVATGKRKKNKSEDWFVAKGGASHAARSRMAGTKKKKTALTSESRAHELLYGDALKQASQRFFIASDGTEFSSATSMEKYENMLERNVGPNRVDAIERHLDALVSNTNPEVVRLTAKSMLKITTNLLKADTFEAKEKFGVLRLSNKAILKRFVEVPHAIRLLELVGFRKDTKEDENVLAFDFCSKNVEFLEYLKTCIEEYQNGNSPQSPLKAN